MAKQQAPSPEIENAADAALNVAQPSKTKKPARPKFEPTDLVDVKNNTTGRLVYSSPRMMGYTLVWDSYGDVQPMEFAEIQTMKNAHKRFFSDNMVTIDDPDVLEALGVSQFYKHAVKTDDMDALFAMQPNIIKKRVAAMGDGMKATVRSAAKLAIDNGSLDSIKRIKALEESLDCELM